MVAPPTLDFFWLGPTNQKSETGSWLKPATKIPICLYLDLGVSSWWPAPKCRLLSLFFLVRHLIVRFARQPLELQMARAIQESSRLRRKASSKENKSDAGPILPMTRQCRFRKDTKLHDRLANFFTIQDDNREKRKTNSFFYFLDYYYLIWLLLAGRLAVFYMTSFWLSSNSNNATDLLFYSVHCKETDSLCWSKQHDATRV